MLKLKVGLKTKSRRGPNQFSLRTLRRHGTPLLAAITDLGNCAETMVSIRTAECHICPTFVPGWQHYCGHEKGQRPLPRLEPISLWSKRQPENRRKQIQGTFHLSISVEICTFANMWINILEQLYILYFPPLILISLSSPILIVLFKHE